MAATEMKSVKCTSFYDKVRRTHKVVFLDTSLAFKGLINSRDIVRY